MVHFLTQSVNLDHDEKTLIYLVFVFLTEVNYNQLIKNWGFFFLVISHYFYSFSMLEYYDFSNSQKMENKSYIQLQDSYISKYIKRKIHLQPIRVHVRVFLWKETLIKKKSKVSYVLSLKTNFSMDKCRDKKSIRIHIIR